jgi:hypothetical protein
MKIKILIPVLLLAYGAFAQQFERRELKGRIIADTLSGANVNILNKTSGKTVTSDHEGKFFIKGREKDTLVFYSQSFDSRQLILNETHFKLEYLIIPMQVFVNTLDEVVISPYALTGDLKRDDANIKELALPMIDVKLAMNMLFEIDNQSTPDNIAMPGYTDTRYMMKFDEVFKKVARLLSGPPKPKKIVYKSNKIFPVAVQEKFDESFFLETLKLQKDEIGLFLTYCESDPASDGMLEDQRQFELIEFLINKREGFEIHKKQ